MNAVRINDRISYIKASDNPLCADIGIIRNGDDIWLYDVGNGTDNIIDLNDSYNVVLSHFHKDHTGNINNISIKSLFVSKETYRHVHIGEIISNDLYFDNLHIFTLPSSHARGCLGLEIDEAYAFVGDALYSKHKDGHAIYNTQILYEEIRVLESLKSEYLLVSHYDGLIRNKKEVIEELKTIYEMKNNTSEIRIPE